LITTPVAGRLPWFVVVSVIVAVWPAARVAGPSASFNVIVEASGEVSSAAMSIGSPATARFVIVEAEVSMKKLMLASNPTPRVTPATDASVRRGLRRSSRRL
jgi:hypothetical protein